MLNGQSSVMRGPATFMRNGIKFVYSGVQGGPPETLKSSKRLTKNLILEVQFVVQTPFLKSKIVKMDNLFHHNFLRPNIAKKLKPYFFNRARKAEALYPPPHGIKFHQKRTE